jgi:hypothetical protein
MLLFLGLAGDLGHSDAQREINRCWVMRNGGSLFYALETIENQTGALKIGVKQPGNLDFFLQGFGSQGRVFD